MQRVTTSNSIAECTNATGMKTWSGAPVFLFSCSDCAKKTKNNIH